MSLGPARGVDGELPSREGLGEVSFRVKDADAFVERLESPGFDAVGRFYVLPHGPRERWLLVHAPGAQGVRTVLVRLIPA